MQEKRIYYAYSDYLKKRYGEKVYKLPVNLPAGCPNRTKGKHGCTFCAESGTGFEALDPSISVTKQLITARKLIEQKYHAHKYIAYFQNYTNTYLPLDNFRKYILEASCIDDIVEIAISTRPDCIRDDYLDFLKTVENSSNIRISFELGLQTANYHTLQTIMRGHGLAEFIDAVLRIKKYGFDICTHVILNLPGDDMADCIETSKILSALEVTMVKIHSLYIAKNTLLCEAYENGTIAVCSKAEYIQRLITFLEYLNPEIPVERLFSRIPEKDSVFSNWGTSWWKLKEEFLAEAVAADSYQGRKFDYLNGPALKNL